MNEPTQRISAEFRGERYWMDAKLSALDSDTFRKIVKTEDIPTIAQIFADTIADWDITMGDDPYPPTADNLMRVPLDLWYSIMKALCNAALTNATIELATLTKNTGVH